MVDVREVRGDVFREVNARFISAQLHYGALRPAVSPDQCSELLSSEVLKKEFKEYLESLPFSPGSVGSLHVSLDERLRLVGELEPRMSGVEAEVGRLAPKMSDMTVGTERLHAKMGGAEAGMHGLTAGTERLDARISGVEAEVGGVAPTMSAMMAGTKRVDARLSGVEAEVGGMAANMPGITTGMKDAAETWDEILTMLMAAQGNKVETPRQACIFPGNYAHESLTDSMRDALVWKTNLAEFVQGGFKVEKTNFTKNLRLFLVCARTEQLVPCGYDGKGYEVRITRERARVAFYVAKAVVEVASATLAAVFAAQPLGSIIDAAGTVALGGAAGVAQFKLDKTVSDSENRAEEIPSQEVNVLEGAAYKTLKRFVLEVECTARLELTDSRKKAKKKGGAPPKKSFVFFKDVMQKVQTKTGYHWELTP